ncbi:hypothetical protein BMETH_439_1 [methanotrophic bacterial endosymbiont of Bathymodiolus sp.]|nr:hypothetical protein BMETH_439_1 [methanotrophic bacterial endosymbiont of Bathymodiolus sp.]
MVILFIIILDYVQLSAKVKLSFKHQYVKNTSFPKSTQSSVGTSSIGNLCLTNEIPARSMQE